MVLFALCACTFGGVSVSVAGQVRAPASGAKLPAIDEVGPGRLERLEQWLKAAARHSPGEDDEALTEAAAWTNDDLKKLWVDVNALTQIIRLPPDRRPSKFTIRSEDQKRPTLVNYTATQFKRLTALACSAGGNLNDPPGERTAHGRQCIETADQLDADLRQLSALVHSAKIRGDDNYIIRRGALLHGDVAMLAPYSMEAPGDVRPTGGLERFRMEISDGQEIDLRQSAVHWEMARMLLDFVRPQGSDHADPGRDDMVRQWYRATASWMQLREDHDKRHLDRARTIFPNDPDLLFLSASQHETYAGVPIQTAVRSAVLPVGVTMDVGVERAELREAEGLYRRVLELRPDHAEARMRYGRVLGGLAKHAEAAPELRHAIAGLSEPEQQYYAELFLGAEEAALGNRAAARAAYDRAAELFPLAQSPLLGLSEVARRSGDRAGALKAIDRLFTLTGEDRDEHDDPWWWYYTAQARDAEDLLEAMWLPYRTDRLQ
jgi:tetratricopeptide (TPR) repeat protein